MIWLQSCPRCKQGALYTDEDDSRHCLHCGYVRHSPEDTASAIELAELLAVYGASKSLTRAAANAPG